MAMYELVLQVSLRFLYHRKQFTNWDRDVALLLRLEGLHRHFFDECLRIVQQRSEAQDVNTRDALTCEFRVVITCVSTLFRLERKRRHEMSSAVGDIKYLAFIYLFRIKIQDSCDYFLSALADVFKWIPKVFLDEWLVLCLNELLQIVNNLSNVVKQTALPQSKQLRNVRMGSELIKVFAVALRRTSDPDLQVMLVRALGMDCPALISLLRFLLSPSSLNVNGGRDAICIQMNALNFLSTFVNLDIALPVRAEWESKNSKPSDEDLNEDAEVIEQLKGELLIRMLGPRMIEEEHDDPTLWEFMVELMFPNGGGSSAVKLDGTSRMLPMAVTFRSLSVPPNLLTSISRKYFHLEEAFLRFQQALYTAQDVNSPIDYELCVASHWRRIEQYCDRIIENEGQEERSMVHRVVELNLRCLIALASRKAQFPAIQDAFKHNQVLSCNFVLREPALHVLAIVLVVTYIIVDPNLAIDETVCPRISVSEDSSKPDDLLWKLQQHLAVVDMDQRHFEALMVEMTTLQAFVSTARQAAIRSLLRLLCPNRMDSNLKYATKDDKQREYVAKGAFSTVYRQKTIFSKPEYVAVKVVEHQRRAGEMCAVNGLFNEVSILSQLRGELSATQLVDYGNCHEEQNFGIVMEFCPCSLTEWRDSIKRADSVVPFRSCVIMILRAFEEACCCLNRIHEAGVCHFDIKVKDYFSSSKGWLCFADFGEAKVVDTDRIPVRTATFSSFSSSAASPGAPKRTEKCMSLTRTRGTEAIKSPEVLKIKGSEVAVKVTLASDIWSIGCLLFELVTQELLFQNDDWAGLYAHLVVTQDQPW
ncbi:uncharacterized protein PITG_08312 [Phytophthora infestans T30-4]|uniref:Protein kinase domain-containing protein n=1 Tax=Phytophthora infestans (strain T30-4) TaxID=403677 RepID=D0NAA6_PHYIT|nr:uncharacterized protein PITG_08312 [Phytophthora infestans T30-4]EEY54764.1 conserved hypothetical protein [Phytophthora infestans T30-4]|eukprot:XP_002903709.1 conserved hypothetical protein [Phytophthora infestans T30-4]